MRMQWIRNVLLVAFGLLHLSCLTLAQGQAQGELGAKAAPWTVREWIQGGPVTPWSAGDTNIYVIEFWATWCGPCLQSIPHLTRLRQKYREQGVVFVGMSREEPEVVKPYVQRMGSNMTYAVALDLKDATTRAYLGAMGGSAIPRAFVIGRDQRVLWTGHPMAGLDEILQEILEGRYTLDRAKAGAQFLRDAQRYLLISSTVGNTAESQRIGKRIVAEAKEQPHLLLQFAQVILFDHRIKGRDLKLALEAANEAVVATKRSDVGALQIYAHALSMSSRREEAISVIQEAIERATQSSEKQALEADLAAFRKSPLGTR